MLKVQKKVKKILFAPLLVVVFSFVMPLFPTLTPSANALTGSDIEKQTQAWQILSGIAFAAGNNLRDTLTTQQADACDFIKPGDAVRDENGSKISGEDSYSIPVGYTVSSGDGLWNSGNPPVSGIRSGLSYIGITNCTDFAKKLGYTISGPNYRSPDNAQTIKDNASKLGNALAKTLNVAWGTAPNYMDYLALLNAFSLGCQAQYRQIYTPDDSISTGHSTDEINRNLEAQKNGDAANSGQGHYYINIYKDTSVNRHVYYVGSDNFATANVGYGLSKNEQAGKMGCTRDNQGGGLGVIRWWLSQHTEFADEYAAKVKIDDPKAGSSAVTQNATGTPDGSGTTSTCNVEGVGWIICPVMRLMANVVDAAYGFVASLLVVQPLMTTGATADVYSAWSSIRTFANVAFVIVFIIIIYSQLTGAGINNYGIKKMLPRLIVAAILVNVSYWICAIAVDLSNILGSSVNGLLHSAIPTKNYSESSTGAGLSGWIGMTGVVLIATGAALYIGLSALLPAVIAALLAIVTVFLVLTLRQALIILLVIISPLAFVAYLLPNTEGLFKKWRELFQTLLLMFPIIAFIFGASALASTIVMNGATGPYKIAIQIMGALIAIIPLALTPVVMKTAGGLLGKFGGAINNPNKGPFDRMKKGAENIRNRQQDRRAIRSMNGGNVFGGGQFRRQAKRGAIDASLKRERSSLEQQHVAEEAVGEDGQATRFGRKLAGAGPLGGGADSGAIQRALSNATFTIDEAIAKDIKAESVTVRSMDAAALKSVIGDSKSPEAKKAAAMQRLVKIADPIDYATEVNAAFADTSERGSVVRRAAAEALGADGPGFLKASDIDRLASGKHKTINPTTGVETVTTLQQIADANVQAGVYSQEKIVAETTGNLQFAWDSTTTNAGKQKMVDTSAALKANPNLNGKIKHNAQSIDNMALSAARP